MSEETETPKTADVAGRLDGLVGRDDLPGSLALADAVRRGEWPHTTDARTWVTAWMLQLKETPEIYKDEGAMIGWFANAIMAGYDTAMIRCKDAVQNGEM